MRVRFVACVLATLATPPVIAATHHHSSHQTHHRSEKTHHASTASKHGSASQHAGSRHAVKPARKPTAHPDKTHGGSKPAAPGGAIAVGSGGTKLFCAGHASPLLVRKATQGSGTTVTVICR